MEGSIEHVERSVPHVFKLVFSNNREVPHVPSMTFRLLDDSRVTTFQDRLRHEITPGFWFGAIVVDLDLIHPP